MPRLAPENFWEFSLAFYCKPNVAKACLSLQDRRAADVNLILLGCWLAIIGYRLTAPMLDAAEEKVAPWRGEVLESLRRARRNLGGPMFEQIRQADRAAIKHGILSLELEAERVAQRLIAAAAETHLGTLATPGRVLAQDSLMLYLGRLIAAPEPADEADVAAILAAM
jgi:uncharacterized protein (TIGR02444 family)